MTTTANLGLEKIAQTDYQSSYPTTQNSNMDAIDEAISSNAAEFAAYVEDTNQEIANINDTIAQLKPEGTLTLLDAYPVGSIYMSTNSTSPAKLFGGAWEALEAGRLLLAAGTGYAAGSTGGSATHTHTGPAHTHTMAHTHTGPAHTHVYGARFGSYYGNLNTSDEGGGAFELWNGSTSAWATSKYGTGTGTGTSKVNTGMATSSASKTVSRPNLTTNTSSSGTGNTGAASNSTTSSSGTGNTGSASSLPPYLAVYMWKRTA